MGSLLANKAVDEEPCARPGFASTALYFERLAQKEMRDDDRRRRLSEVAGFYRSLAKIIPDMPIGYKNNNGSKPTSTRAHASAAERRRIDHRCRLGRQALSFQRRDT